jgi:capsular polysaccharide export protein
MGPFFWKFDRFCSDKGARVYRICFNGGDYIYARKNHVTNYRGTASDWETYISHFMKKNAIDAIFVYGDCRFYHRKAIASARKLKIEVFVFEEGYVRPNFFTLEREGANGYSKLPKSKANYKDSRPVPEKKWGAFSGHYSFQKWSLHAVVYYLFMKLLHCFYPTYEHHRNASIILEIIWGIQNFVRKGFFYIKEKQINRRLSHDLSNKYFIAPLQTLGDFQISVHSRFSGMENFIHTTIASFAQYAPNDLYLMFKHHPIDRGRRNYTDYIRRVAERYAVADRVLSVHDVHLPTCLKNAIGTVTINSTVGISSLFHQTPTITLGSAFYDIEGLTCQGMSLDRFWTHHKPPQQGLFQKFKSHIIDQTQVTGSFYSHFPEEWSIEKTTTWSLNTNRPKAIKV